MAPESAGEGNRQLSGMARRGSAWLAATGPSSAAVLSSRVRLARNLQGLPFPHRADPRRLYGVVDRVDEALVTLDPERREFPLSFRMDGLGPLDRQFLLERHLISRELAGDGQGRAVKVGLGETLSLMVNEEDHLRIQSIHSGLSLGSAWSEAMTLDRRLEKALDFAWSESWGYLTACPTNAGTGLRASVLVHLPGLVLTKQIQRVLQGLSQMGVAVRGLYGEGSEVMGNFFQFSNQTALGKSEKEMVEGLGRVLGQVIEQEERAQEVLLKDARAQVEDKIWRAYGILRHCRSVSSKEVLALASALRLGVSSGVISSVSPESLNRLLVYTQPAHLQLGEGRQMDPMERDVKRAEVTRALFGDGPPSLD